MGRDKNGNLNPEQYIIRHPSQMAQISRHFQQLGQKITFVPTMGYLHKGHLSLVNQAKKYGDKIVVSIFVNPTQFNDPEDLLKYPRDEHRDLNMLAEAGVDIVFIPSADEIYPEGFKTNVSVSQLSELYEGRDRIGHFSGVATVVTILFNIIKPNAAVFGEKDFQQLRIIEQLVVDLKIETDIIRGELVREVDGLALSSRNVRLSAEGRISALKISKSLFAAYNVASTGQRVASHIKQLALDILQSDPNINIFYLEIVNEDDLMPIAELSSEFKSRMLIAAGIDGVRLIDNISLGYATQD